MAAGFAARWKGQIGWSFAMQARIERCKGLPDMRPMRTRMMPGSSASPEIGVERQILGREAIALAGVATAAWATVAVVFAAQGYAISVYRQAPQPWWPSLGYSAAIFSVWLVMTVPIIAIVRRLEHSRRNWRRKSAFYISGLPIAAIVHVGLFALLYWPVYNDGGRIPNRWAMGERMFLSNLDTNTLFYAMLVGLTVMWTARMRRAAIAPAPGPNRSEGSIRVRTRGQIRVIRLNDIEWIGAAGNYVEIHESGSILLVEESLSSMMGRLPPGSYARIHRGVIVPVAGIVQVSSLGRGDAMVRLAGGEQLRLSRRYRKNLEAWFEGARNRDPG
ncbi:MAG: LytTR family DNA-binding domain-containing protein [Candidatus Sphingomonas colombiensis]|nr:LytTR family DNA-binding domain-containing protein [Sphingomonas sp.]WEK43182.1 MAG: LytTR family DNA-binding domain-containing protein [Sphingomonas sp.]